MPELVLGGMAELARGEMAGLARGGSAVGLLGMALHVSGTKV